MSGREEDGMLSVLVVDDRVDFRRAFAELLGTQPDMEVALLDRGLPDGDGLKLMRPLRQANPHGRVLVMSATVEMRHPDDAIEAGADGVIDKVGPFERAFALIRGDGGC